MAKTLYDYWFVQFDFPNEQGKPYKTSGGKMVYNAELKREIPEGWEVKKLNDTLRIVRGASPRPIDDYMAETGCPWIKISDATAINHWFIIGTKEYIKEEGVKSSRELQPGTLILSNSASPAIPKIVQIRACVHDGWLIVDSYKNGLYNEFMLFYFENFRSKIINMGSGSIFKNLKTEYIKDLNIAIPPIHLLKKSKVIFDNIYKQVLTNAIQNQQLTELRDWLLPMLMNGQVTVKEAEESLSMAAEPSVEYKKG
jgi:type I restriction enzyme S subunit